MQCSGVYHCVRLTDRLFNPFHFFCDAKMDGRATPRILSSNGNIRTDCDGTFRTKESETCEEDGCFAHGQDTTRTLLYKVLRR